MRNTRAKALLSTICANAGVKEPTLNIRALQGGYGFYNPFVNRITLDSRVVEGLNTNDLTLLVAHEVGHVRQRRQMLQKALPNIVVFFAIVIATFFGLAMARATFQAALVSLFSVAMLHFSFSRFTARWRPFMDELELDADGFADAYVGQPGAVRAIGPRCESLLV